MEDEDTKIPETSEPEKTPESVSIVDEARAIRDEIVKAKEDLQKENDRKQKLQADELLSSTAGKSVEAPVETEDEKWAKGAKERYAGTGMSPVEDDDGE